MRVIITITILLFFLNNVTAQTDDKRNENLIENYLLNLNSNKSKISVTLGSSLDMSEKYQLIEKLKIDSNKRKIIVTIDKINKNTLERSYYNSLKNYLNLRRSASY